MRALLGAFLSCPGQQPCRTDLGPLEGRRLAMLCQKVENLVVGAPCGIMDQMASSLGQAGQLLALLCQPAEVQASVPIPQHIAFWGVDSGVRHSVGGSDYGSLGGGHLTNVSPSVYSEHLAEIIPEEMSGAEFLKLHGPHRDDITTVDLNQTYAVRQSSAHPIHEHFRVNSFRTALMAPEGSPGQLRMLGELMFQSHASYSSCKLGSPGTDREAAAPIRTVSTSLTNSSLTGEASESAVNRIVSKYKEEMKLEETPKVFRGSSLGASEFGSLAVQFD
eukprot:gene8147-1397_t